MLSTQPSNLTKKFPAELQSSSLHPSAAGSPLLSPRPSATGFAVPPSPRVAGLNGEGIDQWFQDLQKYEATLGAMAVASEDPKFREELGTIEQWFKLLSESEQTASLYTLLQHARPGQVKFLSAVLQQMSDGNQTATNVAESSNNKPSRGMRPPSLNLPSTPTGSQFESATVENDAAGAKAEQGAKVEQGQELVVKPAEENSWASMVATPQDLMFKKASEPQSSAGVVGPAPASASVPDPAASGIVGPAAGMAAGLAAGMMNPFNMAMLNNLGFSTEAQILAVQLVMSGMVQPSGIQKPVPPNKHHNRGSANVSNNWRTPGSARYPGSALRSSGLRSSGLKSALKANTPKSAAPSAGTLGSATTPKEEDIDPELLKDIPTWLKSLRLHKYTDCFKGMTWEEMVDLNEEQLEKKGVVALGARRRMIKTFENVKRKMGIEFTPMFPVTAGVEPSGSLPAISETTQLPHSAAPAL
jgi:hypothetical protein